jgi:hypothetical protein
MITQNTLIYAINKSVNNIQRAKALQNPFYTYAVPQKDKNERCSRTHPDSVNERFVRFEVFTAVTMNNAVFWDVASCKYCVNRRFGGTYRLHLQGIRIRERGTSVSRWLQTEEGGDTFIRNVGLHNIYMAPHPRRRHYSNETFVLKIRNRLA